LRKFSSAMLGDTPRLWGVGLCARCLREARGFGFSPGLAKLKGNDVGLCSRHCQERYMVDPTPNEKAALDEAAGAAGRHIEVVGKTDFMDWTEEEFDGLIEAAVTAFVEKLKALVAKDREIPF
jgi:hypothetical protein